MRKMQVALVAVLFALATPAFAQVVQGADGHYYRLVPLRHERFATARAEAVQPVAPTSANFQEVLWANARVCAGLRGFAG
jgi:hypothetical protein